MLSSVGLNFLIRDTYLLPLMIASLFLSLVMLGHRARQRRGFGPLLLGIAAATAILGGRFFLNMPLFTYGGIALLIFASIWNAWPCKHVAVTAGIRTGSGRDPCSNHNKKEVSS